MKLKVDKAQRLAKTRAHSGVHLLFAALRNVLNRNDIKQAGSFVDEDYGRLDFNADKPLNYEQLLEIENMVNNWIYQAIDSNIFETTLEDAIKRGAIAFFTEKYGEKVRVVEFKNVDIELCGGTHVKNTAEIGAFKIIAQEAVASGIKRLVVVTGPKVAKFAQEKEQYILDIAARCDTAPAQIIKKAEKLQKQLLEAKQELDSLRDLFISSQIKNLKRLSGQFSYIVNADDFKGIRFKELLNRVRDSLDGSILMYSREGNFAIISDGSFSAKEFSKSEGLRGGGNDKIVQGRDLKILEIVKKYAED